MLFRSVIELSESSIGSGNNIALGSLHTTRGFDIDPSERISMALDAAITISTTCIGPVDIISL